MLSWGKQRSHQEPSWSQEPVIKHIQAKRRWMNEFISLASFFLPCEMGVIKLNIHYPKCLGPEMFWIWGFSGFWNICPSLNTTFIYVSYTPYTHSPEATLYNRITWQHFDCELSHGIKCGFSHLLHQVGVEKLSNFEEFRFWNFWIRDDQPAVLNSLWCCKG